MSVEAIITCLNGAIKSKASVPSITECFHKVEETVAKDGLEKRLLDKLCRQVLFLPKQHLIVRGICLMVPRDEVLPDTIDFLLTWIIDSIRTNSKKELSIKALLQWLTGAVYCKVIAAKDLQHSYYLLLSLLSIPGYANEICHLLYYVTEPNLITTYTVKKLLMIRFPKKNYSHAALLSLYKRLKPHLVHDVSITAYNNDLDLLPVLPTKLLDCFAIAMEKRRLAVNVKSCRYPNWRLQTIAYKRRKHEIVVYVSEMTLTEALHEAIQSDIYLAGSVFESFLMNPYGCVFLALGGRELHELFNIFVEKELEAHLPTLCFKQKDEFLVFLTNLRNLMESYGEPFASLDRFLKTHLGRWNGVLYTRQMFDLIGHVVVTDYDEFFEGILSPLYRLNVKFKDREFSKYTIRSLGQCLANNIMNLQSKKQILQIKDTPRPNREALKQFERSFQHLCVFFVNAFENNSSILHEITDSYAIFTGIIDGNNYNYMSLPLGIAHKILINSDFILVDKFCMILTKQIEHERKSSVGTTSVPSESVRLQLRDLVCILFKNILRSQIFDKTESFRAIDEKLMKITNIRKCFRSRRSISFMPLVWINRNNVYQTEFNSTLYMDMVREYCRHFADLINIAE